MRRRSLAAPPPHTEPARTPGGNTLGTRENTLSSSRASEHQIHNAIAIVYSDHTTAGKKPPNVKELVPLVKAELRKNGHDATYEHIQLYGAEPASRGEATPSRAHRKKRANVVTGK